MSNIEVKHGLKADEDVWIRDNSVPLGTSRMYIYSDEHGFSISVCTKIAGLGIPAEFDVHTTAGIIDDSISVASFEHDPSDNIKKLKLVFHDTSKAPIYVSISDDLKLNVSDLGSSLGSVKNDIKAAYESSDGVILYSQAEKSKVAEIENKLDISNLGAELNNVKSSVKEAYESNTDVVLLTQDEKNKIAEIDNKLNSSDLGSSLGSVKNDIKAAYESSDGVILFDQNHIDNINDNSNRLESLEAHTNPDMKHIIKCGVLVVGEWFEVLPNFKIKSNFQADEFWFDMPKSSTQNTYVAMSSGFVGALEESSKKIVKKKSLKNNSLVPYSNGTSDWDIRLCSTYKFRFIEENNPEAGKIYLEITGHRESSDSESALLSYKLETYGNLGITKTGL